MERKLFLTLLPLAGLSSCVLSYAAGNKSGMDAQSTINSDSRDYWISVLLKLTDPVLRHLSAGTLKTVMPVESAGSDREKYTYLEAFGRTLAGISPWLELGPEQSDEGKLRAFYIDLTKQCLHMAADPQSPDFMNFNEGGQPLVDSAFLAHGLLRGFNNLWLPLDPSVKNNIVSALKSTRINKPVNNNWLLFGAMVEAFLLKSGHEWDNKPVGYALKKFSEWYKGDGTYGDGHEFHWDYYNSFVIHPMLLDVVKTLNDCGIETALPYEDVLKRARRYAVIQERLISPEGTYPPVGRSLCYRFGAFQILGQIALMKQLPDELSPAQVRSALSSVITREVEAPGTFDGNGWLTIGVCGHQPKISESYISTGSLYLCTTGLLPLGLPAHDPFWATPSADWTAKKIWKGIDVPADHAYDEQ
jgi:hypothetical protein